MKILRFANIVLMVFLCGSCGEDYTTRLRELILDDLRFSNGSGSKVLTFRNEDLSNYAINSNQDWCIAMIDKTSITIKVSANTAYDDRTATITLVDIKDGVTSRTFSVRQMQASGVVIETKNYDVGMSGDEICIEVLSNVEYSVQSEVDWITYSTTRALSSSTLILKVDKNNSGSKRIGTVKVINTKTDEVEVIKVTQAFAPVYSVSPSTLTIDELGGELNIQVETNIQVDTYLYDSWVRTLGREETANGFVQKVGISGFTLKQASRITEVTFGNPTYNMLETVTITQYRTLYIPESTMELYVGDIKQIELYNANDIDVVWSSSDESVVEVSDGYVKSIGEGTAIVTVKSQDGLYSDNIKLMVKAPIDVNEYLFTSAWSISYEYDRENTDSIIATSIGCTLENKSPYNLELTKCIFYNGGRVLNVQMYKSTTNAFILSAGGKTDIEVSIKEALNNPYFEWEYIYNGEKYIYKSDTLPTSRKKSKRR